MSQVIIYGAVADRRESPTLARIAQRIRVYRHLTRDLRSVRRFDTSGIDFRNFISTLPENIGDVAIAETVVRLVRQIRPEVRIVPCNWGELGATGMHSLGPDDILIVAGSGYFAFDQDGRLPPRVADDLARMNQSTCMVVVLGVGANRPGSGHPGAGIPIDAIADRQLIRSVLLRASRVSVRDDFSLQLLSGAGGADVSMIGDPALHFASVFGDAIPEIDRTDDVPIVGINFSFHGPNSTALLRENLIIYSEALLEIQRCLKCRYKYFVHFPTEVVIPAYLNALGVHTEVVQGEPLALVREYNGVDLHIAGMLHSSILAASVDTPCIALAYDIKHGGFFDLFGLGEYCLPASGISKDALVERCLHAFGRRDEIRATIHGRRLELENATKRFLSSSIGRAP